MRPIFLWCLALALLTGCETNVRFKNSVPNATLKDVRWVAEGSGHAYASDGDPLRPGETSESITVARPQDENSKGKLHFELAVDGKHVSLVTERTFQARPGDTKTFTVTADTQVENPVLESLDE